MKKGHYRWRHLAPDRRMSEGADDGSETRATTTPEEDRALGDEAIKDELARLETRRCQALMAGDVETLSTLVDDDLRHVHGNGNVDDKAAYLNGVATKYRFHRVERGDLTIRVYADIAVVMGPLSQTVSTVGADGSRNIEAMTTQVWRRTADGWKQNTCHNQFLKVS